MLVVAQFKASKLAGELSAQTRMFFGIFRGKTGRDCVWLFVCVADATEQKRDPGKSEKRTQGDTAFSPPSAPIPPRQGSQNVAAHPHDHQAPAHDSHAVGDNEQWQWQQRSARVGPCDPGAAAQRSTGEAAAA
eukprot:m.8997 g.8997  ORF g.8997 m.8997 type:complete len:133 (-) comp5350_c0_seq1:199-597(-)